VLPLIALIKHLLIHSVNPVSNNVPSCAPFYSFNSLSSDDKFDIFHWITSDENISTSIHPPLKPKPPLESSYNNLLNGGSNAVITLHKPKQSYIYSPLGQTFWIWYQDNLEYVLNSSEFASYNISKVLRVFKRFRVENFAWIGPLEIFILNFSICRVFTTELYNNWRTCSYTSFSQPSEAKNMTDFEWKWRHFHDYWSLNSW
jgi:hypothetical protein